MTSNLKPINQIVNDLNSLESYNISFMALVEAGKLRQARLLTKSFKAGRVIRKITRKLSLTNN